MLSSSAYAIPITIDLRPGRWERALLLLSVGLALGALALCALPLIGKAGIALGLLGYAAWRWRDYARRPVHLILYADGSVDCAHGEGALGQAAKLLQASTFVGLTQLSFAEVGGQRFDCIVFPDRQDAEQRHRLRVWLATHRPAALIDGVSA